MRISSAFIILWLGLSFLLSNPSYSEKVIHKMKILLVPVGEIDTKVIESLQSDVGKISLMDTDRKGSEFCSECKTKLSKRS